MKKTLFLLLTLLSWQIVSAEVVTERQARQRAADFFAAAEVKTKASATRPEDFKLVATFPEAATKSSPISAPAMYIFDRPAGGYAIVSGDDVARPVLGYSLTGRFPITDIPDNLRALLQWYADIIDFARQQHWAASPMPAADGLDPANTVKLQTALWNQYAPFNDLAAEVNGKKPPIGCVATAIAIVMRYHKWPHQGTGTLPSYDYTKEGVKYHVEGFALGHEYDWDKMPENYRNCSTEEAAQMARLLYDIAVMSTMSFYPGGSGAPSTSALKLTEYFGYDRQMSYYNRGYGYSDEKWEQFIIDEINAERPVMYCGYRDNGGGHEFVLDGYNGRYFSINFGWGGTTNGYYTVTPLEGHEEDLLMYYKSQDMTCRIMPDAGGEPVPIISMYSANPLPTQFEIGKAFKMNFGVRNSSLGAFDLDFRFALCDTLETVKEVISPEMSIDLSASGSKWTYANCTITKPLAEGDRLLLQMKDPDTGQWAPILQPRKFTIVFTKRSLSELMEVGFAEDPVNQDYLHSDRLLSVYFKAYKDLIWTVQGSNGNQLIDSYHNVNSSTSTSTVSWSNRMADPNDLQCDTLVYEIWLPTGNYILNLFNPATGERMSITLEL